MFNILASRMPAVTALSARHLAARLARELHLAERARSAGIDNRPAGKDDEPDAAQHELFERATELLGGLRQRTEAQLHRLAHEVARLTGQVAPPDFTTPERALHRELGRIGIAAHEHLRSAAVEEQRRWVELCAFRHANRLGRDAAYPATRFVGIFVAALIWFFESLMNMSLFANASDLGEVGGLFTALSCALPNVGLALLIGFFGLRYAGHVQWLKRFLGMATTFALGSLVVVYNLYLGHYRDLLAVAPDTAQTEALARLSADPFGITNIDALVLLLIGLIVAGFSVADAYMGFADTYPGYTTADRRYRAARQARRDMHTRLRAEIIAAAATGTRALLHQEQWVRDRHAQAMRPLDAGGRALAAFARDAGAIERAVHVSLRLYRDTNRRVRTEPPPAYFAQYPALDPASCRPAITPDIDPRLLRPRLHAATAGLLAEADAVKARLRQTEAQAVAALDALALRTAADLNQMAPMRPPPVGMLTAARQG